MADLRVLCCTANVGNTQMDADTLAQWVPREGKAHGVEYQVVAVGMQESVFTVSKQAGTYDPEATSADPDEQALSKILSADEDDAEDDAQDEEADAAAPSGPTTSTKSQGGWGSLLSDKFNNKCSAYITKVVEQVLGPNFVKVEVVQAMQMRLLVYRHKSTELDPKSIETKTENTGIGGIVGNKGGQVVKLSINGTSLCFVSSHLAAHEGGKHLKARNDSVAEILHGARVGRKALDLASQFHHCFFMGDMNYRVDISTLPEYAAMSLKGLEKPAKKAKRKEQWDVVKGWVDQLGDAANRDAALAKLLAADELSTALSAKDVLVGFVTSKPTFKPTFKVHRFKELTYVDNRVPSYCDRILWKSLPGFGSQIVPVLNSYEACGKYLTSDHKPVRQGFVIQGGANRRFLLAAIGHFKITLTNIKIELAGRATKAKKGALQDTPDPYIKLFSDPMGVVVSKRGKVPKSSHVMNKIQHTFAGPLEGFVRAERDQLALSHLMITVMDWDVISADDGFGSAALCLEDVAKECIDNKRAPWTLPITQLTLDGQSAGTITCEIAMEPVEVAVGNGGGCCTLL